MLTWTPAALSLVVPGLGQLVRGRAIDGVLMLWAAAWLRLILAAIARAGQGGPDPLDAALYGLLVFDSPGRFPILTVVTVFVVALHLWSASDARRSHSIIAGRDS